MQDERRAEILDMIRRQGAVRISALKKQYPDFSEMTLRRDLDFLAGTGLVKRTHGGASRPPAGLSEFDYFSRSVQNEAAKESIAEKALGLLEENRSVYFDSGTTIAAFVRKIPDMRLFAITNALYIALELFAREKTEVILLGGSLSKSTVSTNGPSALSQLDGLNIDTAFIAAGGFSLENGLTNPYIAECELKRKVVRTAKKVIVLLDHSKFHRNLPYTFAVPEEIDILVTDGGIPEDILRPLLARGIQVVTP